MADFVLARKSRNIASSAVHIFLNLLLGIGTVMITILSGNPALGVILVLTSKWRVFAVRARYLWLNIKANLVDIIVGLSVVILTYHAGASVLPVDFVLAAFYVIWLLVIKSKSSEGAIMAQALISVFFGVSAAVFMTVSLDPVVLSLICFVIGYSASRHILAQSSDKDFTLSTLVCGLVFAEVSLISSFWTIIYTFGASGIRIPQLAIILTIFAFVYVYVRQAVVKYQEDFRFRHILGPVLFGTVLIAIILIGFSNPIFNL